MQQLQQIIQQRANAYICRLEHKRAQSEAQQIIRTRTQIKKQRATRT